MSSARSGSPAGRPSTIAVRRGPCDSPAVIQRRRDMRHVTYTATREPVRVATVILRGAATCYFLRRMRPLSRRHRSRPSRNTKGSGTTSSSSTPRTRGSVSSDRARDLVRSAARRRSGRRARHAPRERRRGGRADARHQRRRIDRRDVRQRAALRRASPGAPARARPGRALDPVRRRRPSVRVRAARRRGRRPRRHGRRARARGRRLSTSRASASPSPGSTQGILTRSPFAGRPAQEFERLGPRLSAAPVFERGDERRVRAPGERRARRARLGTRRRRHPRLRDRRVRRGRSGERERDRARGRAGPRSAPGRRARGALRPRDRKSDSSRSRAPRLRRQARGRHGMNDVVEAGSETLCACSRRRRKTRPSRRSPASISPSGDLFFPTTDVAEALATAAGEKTEMAFVDVMLDGGAGLALVHHLTTAFPGIAVYALAPEANLELGSQAVALGAVGFMSSPPSGDALLHAVGEVSARRARRAREGAARGGPRRGEQAQPAHGPGRPARAWRGSLRGREARSWRRWRRSRRLAAPRSTLRSTPLRSGECVRLASMGISQDLAATTRGEELLRVAMRAGRDGRAARRRGEAPRTRDPRGGRAGTRP